MRTRAGRACILLTLAVILPAAAQTPDDPGILGTATTATAYAPYEEVWWSTSLGAGSFLDASPVIVEDKVIVADWSGNVVALDAVTGKEVWRHEMEARVSSTPAVALGRVFVADLGGALIALDADTGAVLDETVTGPTQAPITFHEGKIFVGNEAGEMSAYTATTLDLLWRFDVDSVQPTANIGNATIPTTCSGTPHPSKPIRTGAVVYAGMVYFGSMNHYVYAVDEKGQPDGTTTPEWIYLTGDIVLADPVIDAVRGRILFASYDESVYSLPVAPATSGANPCYGTLNVPGWQAVVPGPLTQSKVHSSPALIGDRLFFGANNGRVYAYDADDGKHLWTALTGAPVLSDPAVANGVVVVGSDDGNLYWFNADNGTQLKRFDVGAPIKTGPTIAGNNTIFATETGVVYRLGGPPPDRPDLVVSGITQSGSGIQVTVHNQGTGPSAATSVAVESNGTVAGTLPVPALQPGRDAVLFLPLDLGPGLHVLVANVDGDGVVLESSETNNRYEGTLFGIDPDALENATVAEPRGGGFSATGWLFLVGALALVTGGGGFAWWWFRGRYEWVDEDEADEDEWE